jgi:hypothetical protein
MTNDEYIPQKIRAAESGVQMANRETSALPITYVFESTGTTPLSASSA